MVDKSSISFITQKIEGTAIFLWGKSWCPYTKLAQDILKSNGAEDYEYGELDTMERGHTVERELLNQTGFNTAPLIYLNGKLFGGINELYSRDKQQILKGILEKARQDFNIKKKQEAENESLLLMSL